MADNSEYGRTVPDSILRQQRQQKIDQAKFQKQTAEQLSKQNKLIAELAKTNAALREELTKADSSTFNAAEADRLAKLQAEVDELEMNIEYERMRKADIQSKHAMCRVDLLQTRKEMGGVTIASDNAAAVDKQITVLENRLDQALVKFNEALSNNKKLRSQIDSLREERQVFQRIYKKLEQELYQRKKEMADKIEQANVDYEERDQLKQQLEKEKVKAEESRRECQEGFLQMDKILEELKATAQEQKRLQIAQMSLMQGNANNGGGNSSRPNGASSRNNNTNGNDTLALTKNGGNNNNNNNNTTANGNNGANGTSNNGKNTSRTGGRGELDSRGGADGLAEDEEADLQTIVDDLKATTGHQDLRLLMDNFIKSEELNFSTYKYINSLDTQRESLEKEIAELQNELSEAQEDAERRKIIKSLENELALTQSQQEALNAKTRAHRQTIEQACEIVQKMYTAIGCNDQAAIATFGTTQVSQLNLNGFLGFVEKRATALLHAYNRRGTADPSASANARRSGDNVSDDDENAGDESRTADNAALVTSNPNDVSSFIGVGPAGPDALGDASQRVKGEVLPQANAGEGAEDTKEEGIMSYEKMRECVNQRMNQRLKKAAAGGKRGDGSKKR